MNHRDEWLQVVKRLKAERIKKQLDPTEMELVEGLISRGALYRLEKGNNATFRTLLRLLDRYEIRLKDILCTITDNPPSGK